MEKVSEGLTLSSIVQRVKDGTMKINTHRHNSIGFKKDENVIEYVKELLFEHEKRESKWLKNPSNKYDEYSKWKYERIINIGDQIGECNINCWDCSNGAGDLYLILEDENTIGVINWENFNNLQKIQEKEGTFSPEQIPNCTTSELGIADKMVTEIDIPTGELVITNFFDKKEIYSPEGYGEINALENRYRLMQYLATLNIGYGQMSNMGFDVYKNEEGTEIIFGSDWMYDGEGNEHECEYIGFAKIGYISCSVWRWMLGDKQVLEEHGQKIPELIKDSGVEDENYMNWVLASVKPGRWVIEHYYDINPDQSFMRDKYSAPLTYYSRLFLKP